ncbi:Vms1/Ankzf1 family peptidyl-tRNA hydrolase [Georgenia sunbinii]|uniref:baeRF2 domain-containing protein n=1 Tax=Georgenia sunbinii TaxID=3117728 RepID=UPI002F261A6D
MQIDWLTNLIPDDDDVVTIAFDATTESELGAQTVLTRWRDLRRTLEARGASAQALDRVGEQVRVPTHVAGRHGRVIVGGRDGVVIDRVIDVPPPLDVAVVGVCVTSLARIADRTVRYLLVEVDRHGADLTLQHSAAVEYGGDDDSTSSVEGGHDVINKVRRAGMASRRLQARAEDSWERNAEAVAEEVDRIVTSRHAEIVLLTGDVRAVALVRDRLGAQAGPLVTVIEGGSRASGVHEDAFERKVEEALATFRARRREDVLDRFRQEEGRDGAATQGLADVVDALRRGQVAELILREDTTGPNSPLLGRTLWVGDDPLQIAADATDLASLGVTEPREVPVGLATGRAAAEQGAGVTIVDEASVEIADGVGALLRWRDASTPGESVHTQSADTSRV